MKLSRALERWRTRSGPYRSPEFANYGAFVVPGPCGADLNIIASPGDEDVPWEHVSVSVHNRCPNWPEMSFVKDLFWDPEEGVMQLHPPRSRWINNHPYCLHLWRPLKESIPLPPDMAVGDKSLGTLR